MLASAMVVLVTPPLLRTGSFFFSEVRFISNRPITSFSLIYSPLRHRSQVLWPFKRSMGNLVTDARWKDKNTNVVMNSTSVPNESTPTFTVDNMEDNDHGLYGYITRLVNASLAVDYFECVHHTTSLYPRKSMLIVLLLQDREFVWTGLRSPHAITPGSNESI